MVAEEAIIDRDIVEKDPGGIEHIPETMEDIEDLQDMYDIDHLEDLTDEEDVMSEVQEEAQQSQESILAIMQNVTVEDEIEFNVDFLKLEDPDEEPTIESIYSLERVQEIYMGVTDLSEFQEFYEVYIRDFMELEQNRLSRLNFVKELCLTWYRIPSISNKRGGT